MFIKIHRADGTSWHGGNTERKLTIADIGKTFKTLVKLENDKSAQKPVMRTLEILSIQRACGKTDKIDILNVRMTGE